MLTDLGSTRSSNDVSNLHGVCRKRGALPKFLIIQNVFSQLLSTGSIRWKFECSRWPGCKARPLGRRLKGWHELGLRGET